MMGAPKTHNVCQPSGSAIIIANNGTTIERPVKSPAIKLPASRNLVREFFMIHSDRDNALGPGGNGNTSVSKTRRPGARRSWSVGYDSRYCPLTRVQVASWHPCVLPLKPRFSPSTVVIVCELVFDILKGSIRVPVLHRLF
jgi:hypothetical protein